MSPEDTLPVSRQFAFRLALAVTVGLTVEVFRGAPMPALAPVIALQLLALYKPAPPFRSLVLLFLAAAFASGLAYAISALTVDYPGLYAIGIGLLYLWGFALCFTTGTAAIGVMMVTMTVVVTSIATTSTGAALGLSVQLLISVAEGILLVYVAHAIFPHPVSETSSAPSQQDGARDVGTAHFRALLATAVILPAHLYLNAENLAPIVVLLTMATMLRQPGLQDSMRYSLGYAAGNALGGVLAAISAVVVSIQSSPILLVAVTAASALLLAQQTARNNRWAPVFLVCTVAYVVLFGLFLSPLTSSNDVAVLDRVVSIVLAAIYTLCAISVLLPPFIARATPERSLQA